jgi:hypothetical protein
VTCHRLAHDSQPDKSDLAHISLLESFAVAVPVIT